MEKQLDFLGTEIKEGDRGVRVHSYSHSKNFKKVTIAKIDKGRKYGDTIGIVTDGNTRIGWTYPIRVMVQGSIKIKL